MLSLAGVTSGYGRIPIIHGISLEVRRGEALGILGHNGMGKTTLLKTIAGQIPTTAGTIRFGDRDIAGSPPGVRARLGLGYVPQGRLIFSRLSVRDNLRMGAAGAGRPESVLDGVLEDLPRLKPILKRAGGVLSGGEQQILALGRCLCGQSDMILLDEPTEGIQPSIVGELIALLKALMRRRALTLVLVEQNLNFIRQVSDRVLVIQRGLITNELEPGQLADAAVVERALETTPATP